MTDESAPQPTQEEWNALYRISCKFYQNAGYDLLRSDLERAKRHLYNAQRELRHARDAARKAGIL